MIIREQFTALKAKKLHKSAGTVYASIFLLVITFVAIGYGGDASTPQLGVVSANQSAQTTSSSNTPDRISVDQLTAANAITNLAETTNLPVAGDLREATTTLYIKKQLSQTDAEVISKPHIVQPTTTSERGITNYVAVDGDSLETISTKFGVSVQTLRWANNKTNDSVDPGSTVLVPRVNGVVYTIKPGDTLESVASKYKVEAEQIVLYNDLDTDGPLVADSKIVLPNGDLPETERPGYVAPRAAPVYTGSSSSNSATNSQSYNYARASVGNRYAAGNCTWYAYERRAAMGRPIGSFWGNAYSWASSARSAGFVVNQTPEAGDIFQTSSGGGGYGHVGIVERVDDQNIYVSDMNYGGYNVITQRTIPRSSLGGYNFIK